MSEEQGNRRHLRLLRKRGRRETLRMGKNREEWWRRVEAERLAAGRRRRQKDTRISQKAERVSKRRPLDKKARWVRRLGAEAREMQARSGRRAILIHPDGTVSPMKMLVATTHPNGVIGSLLGGQAQVLASNADTNVVLLGIQDSICDDEWEPAAYEMLKSVRLHKRVLKIYGRALCARFFMYNNRVLLGDLPLTNFTTGPCSHVTYTRQRQAIVENQIPEQGPEPASDEAVDVSN